MAIPHWPLQDQPREKLLNIGAENLSTAELLAIFLRTGVSGKSALDLSRDLLGKFGGLRPLLEASIAQFCQMHGLGKAKYIQLQACLELSRRYFEENLTRNGVISNSKDTQRFLSERLRHRQQEIFACLFLDSQYRIIRYQELFYGSINSASIFPREVVKQALHHNAAAIIFCHNHPSGDATPSKEDQRVTHILTQALSLMDIKVLDHIIIGDGETVSFADYGLLQNEPQF